MKVLKFLVPVASFLGTGCGPFLLMNKKGRFFNLSVARESPPSLSCFSNKKAHTEQELDRANMFATS